jgi:hypothetical protein
MAEYQLCATELGLLHRRSERRLVDAAAFAQRRDGLVAAMQVATSAFLARFSVPPRPPWAIQGASCFRPSRTRRAPAAPPDSGRPDLPPVTPESGLQEP